MLEAAQEIMVAHSLTRTGGATPTAARVPLARRALVSIGVALALMAPASHPARAQARELSWPEVTVTARLDADGRLHVQERQVMRFTGDWNGGQRIFAKPYGQEFWFLKLDRIDTISGRPQPLVRGDLSGVNEYDWADANTLRWRSRLPDDPPFDGTEVTYILEFLYGNILQPRGDGGYLLDHDFAFTNREGDFSRFQLTLAIDSAWGVPPNFTGRYSTTDLPPGEGFVVSVPLTRIGPSIPAAVRFGASPTMRQALIAALILGLIALFIRLIGRERGLGRLAELTPTRDISPQWLEEHVFAHLPEVVGAAWDDDTSAPEVAATLARLVQEKKLSSSVKTKKFLMFSTHILHLELEVRRNHLQGHERALVDALFSPGETTTDTERVRKRYGKTGFDPASVIKPRITELVESRARGTGETPSRIPTVVLIAAGVALIALGIRAQPGDGAVAAVVIGASLLVYIIAGVFAYAWRRRVSGIWPRTLGFLLPLTALTGVFIALLLISDRFRAGPLVLVGLVVWILALANSVFNIARSRQSPERIARRKRLASARRYFRTELGKAQPELRDEWFPYVLAFGLGSHIDRWFESFGGETRSMARSSGTHTSGNGSASGGSWTGFGGGGGFGGAGGGASFGAAIGGMASSVPSPSSGSGGGGGGGGGSSGGGGGGGW